MIYLNFHKAGRKVDRRPRRPSNRWMGKATMRCRTQSKGWKADQSRLIVIAGGAVVPESHRPVALPTPAPPLLGDPCSIQIRILQT